MNIFAITLITLVLINLSIFLFERNYYNSFNRPKYKSEALSQKLKKLDKEISLYKKDANFDKEKLDELIDYRDIILNEYESVLKYETKYLNNKH